MEKSSIASLIHPYTSAEFFSMYEQNTPFVVHNNFNALQELFILPFLSSLDVLLKSWPSTIQAHLPNLRDEASAIETTPKDAQKLFENGMGLLFNDVQAISPLLEDWIHRLKKDLGLSALSYGRCLIYAIPDGKGTATHFDQNINFVIQIHGTKKWLVAPNTHVENPMTRHTMGQATDPELSSYVSGPMPHTMPENAQSFVLKPGSVLFVPRGNWHSTEAEGDALSLNFTFTAPTWLDLFSAALRSRLALSPNWRATADGFLEPELAEQTLDHLLSALISDLPYWRASDILSATES